MLAITHAHDDHIAGIGDLYDRYQVVELWLPQHAKKLQQVAGNYAEFERVQEEHPDEQTEWPKGSRSMWKTLGENGEVSVRCFSPPGTTRKQAPRSVADLPKSTPQAEAFAKQLKSQGYRFVGPTSVYAFMQNVGVVNDHIHGCFRATDYRPHPAK